MALNNKKPTGIIRQTNVLGKKIVSIITASALTITGTIVGATHFAKNRKKNVDLNPTTSISSDANYTTVDNTINQEPESILDQLNLRETFEKYDLMDYESILEELPLLEDFDINDKEAVKERAKEIYKLSDKEVSVDMIINLIYMINGKYKNIKFKEDMLKFKYLQNMFVSLAEVLDDNIVDCRNAQIGEKSVSPKFNNILYSYMFMSKLQKNPDEILISKQDAIAIAVVAKKQLNNIENNADKDMYEQEALKYYEIFEDLKERNSKGKDTKSNKGYTYVFYRGLAGLNVFMTPYLSEKKAKKLDSNPAEEFNDALAGAVKEACHIDMQEVIDEAIKSGSFGNDVPKYGESYNSRDAAVANKSPQAGNSQKANDKVSSGGSKVSSGSKQVNTPTTKVVIETYVATPVTEAPTKPRPTKPVESTTTPNKDNEKPTNPNKDNVNKPTKAPTTTTKKFVTPTSANEVIVEEGGEVVFEGSKDDAYNYIDSHSEDYKNTGSAKIK